MKSFHCAGIETYVYKVLICGHFFFLMCLNYFQGCRAQKCRDLVAELNASSSARLELGSGSSSVYCLVKLISVPSL